MLRNNTTKMADLITLFRDIPTELRDIIREYVIQLEFAETKKRTMEQLAGNIDHTCSNGLSIRENQGNGQKTFYTFFAYTLELPETFRDNYYIDLRADTCVSTVETKTIVIFRENRMGSLRFSCMLMRNYVLSPRDNEED